MLALLAAAWWLDRGRDWETPRLDPARFAVLCDEAGAAGGTRLVATALHCPTCLGVIRRLRAACDPAGCRDLVALLVDMPRRPGAAEVASLGLGRVWWDSSGVWRERWGHRLYGEVLVFDDTGRLERTVPPSHAPGVGEEP